MNEPVATAPDQQPRTPPKRLDFFERYLNVWVLVCMVVGVAFGKLLPSVTSSLSKLEFSQGSQVNVPIGVLLWLMIYPMMLKVDFSAIGGIARRPKGLMVTLFVNWLVKPFSMALLAWLFKVGSLGGDTSPPELPMNATGVGRLAEWEFVLDLHRPGLGADDLQFRRQAVHHDHDLVQADGLTGVDLSMIGAAGFVAIIAPYHFFIRCDFLGVFHTGEKNISIGKHPHIVVFIAGTSGIGPNDLAIPDEEHFIVIFPYKKHRMLRQAIAGQIWRSDAVRPRTGHRGIFGRSHCRHISGSEAAERIHAWRRRMGLVCRRVTAG